MSSLDQAPYFSYLGREMRGARLLLILLDLAKDDGQQDKEQPFGRVRFLDWQLTPDLRGGDKKNRSDRGPGVQ